MTILDTIKNFLADTGIFQLFSKEAETFSEFSFDGDWWQTAVMFLIAFVLVYLALVKKFEPLLLLPIAIGMLLTNIPGGGMFNLDFFIPDESVVTALESKFIDGFTGAELIELKSLGLPVTEAIEHFEITGVIDGFNILENAVIVDVENGPQMATEVYN